MITRPFFFESFMALYSLLLNSFSLIVLSVRDSEIFFKYIKEIQKKKNVRIPYVCMNHFW